MAYVGGKAKAADHILEVLNDPLFDGMDYMEPFVGYAHVLRRVENKRSYAASDSNSLLLTLLRAVRDRKRLPTVDAREYARLKHGAANTLKRAVAAFTYSYAGKEWGGYTDVYYRNGKYNSYADERKRYYAELADNPQFQRARLRCCDYRNLRPHGKLIYCDPPYANTTGYNSEVFDSDEFWRVVREWSDTNIVLVSEYAAPRDFRCVASRIKHSSISQKTRRRERLFVHQRHAPLF